MSEFLSVFDYPMFIIAAYLATYMSVAVGFRGRYERKEKEGYYRDNHYYVPISPWLEHRYFKILLRKIGKVGNLIKYPVEYNNSKTAVIYADYRELQKVIIGKTMFFPFSLASIALYLCQIQGAGMVAFIYMSLAGIIELSFAYPVMRHDVKRLKSYQYIVANDDEAVLSEARRNPPRLWKINTLLDVFFYFGEARIRYCELQNYLVYRLKNGSLMYILLKDSFETMPEGPPRISLEINFHNPISEYNQAMAIWVDAVIILDENVQNAAELLATKNIMPQDMPENIC